MGQDKQSSPKGEAATERKERLAGALRENLKKRKQQARARKDRDGGSEPKPGAD